MQKLVKRSLHKNNLIKLFTQFRNIVHTQSHTHNGVLKLVEVFLQIHPCFFSHSKNLRAFPLSVVNTGADPEGGDRPPPKTYESNDVHYNFLQFGK